MSSRIDQKAQTRQRILATAKDLFESRGFAATSLREIAHGAGVATGTVFVHFEDKRDLLHTALFDDLEAKLTEISSLAPGPSLQRWLETVTDHVLTYYESRPGVSRVLLKESLFADPPWAQRFSAQFTTLHSSVARRARMDIDAGLLQASLDPTMFGLAYVSYYMFGLLAWAQQSHPEPRRMVSGLVAHHLAPHAASPTKKVSP